MKSEWISYPMLKFILNEILQWYISLFSTINSILKTACVTTVSTLPLSHISYVPRKKIIVIESTSENASM